jgi:hypothetical protein
MIRSISLSVFAALIAVSAQAACPKPTLAINELTLNADGKVTRTVMVKKKGDGQNPSAAEVKYVPVARDIITLGEGDDITLNSAPDAQDAILQAKISVTGQGEDQNGVYATTYKVTEITTSTFAGTANASKSTNTYNVNITSNAGAVCGKATKFKEGI